MLAFKKKKREGLLQESRNATAHLSEIYIYINATAQLSEIYINTGLNGQHA